MRILVPDHYGNEHTEKIKAVSANLEVARLSIQKQWDGFRGLLYKFFPLPLYRRYTHFFLKQQPVYKLMVNGEELNGPLSDIHILLASWAINSHILANLLPFLPNLRWVHSTVTGVNHLLSPEVANNDNIQLSSSKGVHSVAVAEFVLALILTVIKRIPEHVRLQKKRKWQPLEADEVTDKTVGIFGLGNIGREIAKKAKIMRMKVVAIKRTPIQVDYVDALLPPERLNELLEASDFLVICAPLTEETFGIIGKRPLRSMKKNAYLINISREEIVQREALACALKRKWIAGACIDSFHQQPLPLNSPYYSLPNLIITHHSAYFTSRANKRIFDFFLANLKRFITGDQLLGKVDKKKAIKSKIST